VIMVTILLQLVQALAQLLAARNDV